MALFDFVKIWGIVIGVVVLLSIMAKSIVVYGFPAFVVTMFILSLVMALLVYELK
jgi:hypothetical protein